jgi:hypothetical protein
VISRLAWLWAHHRGLLLAFSAAVLVALFFTVRAAVFFVYWSDPAHRDQPIEAWMTPRYVANSYHVPIEMVIETLAIDPEAERRPTLEQLAERRGVSPDRLIADLSAAIAAWKAAHP